MPRKKKETGPVTMTLTDEDLAEARHRKSLHEKKAREFAAQHMEREHRLKDLGEVSELTVPQVTQYDMSGAFTKAAMSKALRAGYAGIANLRKTPQGWVFEALTQAEANRMARTRARQAGRVVDEAAA